MLGNMYGILMSIMKMVGREYFHQEKLPNMFIKAKDCAICDYDLTFRTRKVDGLKPCCVIANVADEKYEYHYEFDEYGCAPIFSSRIIKRDAGI